MLRTLKELHDYTIGAVDGVIIGHVKDLYVDDEAWVARYLVGETGGWLLGRKVLISPMSAMCVTERNRGPTTGKVTPPCIRRNSHDDRLDSRAQDRAHCRHAAQARVRPSRPFAR